MVVLDEVDVNPDRGKLSRVPYLGEKAPYITNAPRHHHFGASKFHGRLKRVLPPRLRSGVFPWTHCWTCFINEKAALTQPAQPKPELPVWHLGGVDALHRRDIYDDVH